MFTSFVLPPHAPLHHKVYSRVLPPIRENPLQAEMFSWEETALTQTLNWRILAFLHSLSGCQRDGLGISRHGLHISFSSDNGCVSPGIIEDARICTLNTGKDVSWRRQRPRLGLPPDSSPLWRCTVGYAIDVFVSRLVVVTIISVSLPLLSTSIGAVLRESLLPSCSPRRLSCSQRLIDWHPKDAVLTVS